MLSSLGMLVIKVKKKRPFNVHSHVSSQPRNALHGMLDVLFTVTVEQPEYLVASHCKGTDLKEVLG